MENSVRELISKEYGLSLLNCVLSELSKIHSFESLAMVIHSESNDIVPVPVSIRDM